MKHTSLRANLFHLAVLGTVILSTVGCMGGRRPVGPSDLSTASKRSSSAPAMSAADRDRLRAVAERRVTMKSDSGYVIGADDLLDIRIPDLIDNTSSTRVTPPPGQNGPYIPVVAQAPLFQQGLRVDANGKVTLPFIGEMVAEGKTPAVLEQDIAKVLIQKQVLRNPQVSVQVIEYRNRVAAVVGSVERPGLYPLTRPGTTVADLVWTAGGPNKEAGRFVEFAPAIKDDEEGGEIQPIRIDLDTLLRANGLHDRMMDPPARPGDVITVSPAGSVLVDGWVTKPGSYPVSRGLTVTGVVTAAGGELFPANLRNLTIARADGAYQSSINVDLDAIAAGRAPDMPIADGDVVKVPAHPWAILPWGVWSLVKDVVRLGASAPIY